MQVPWSSGQVAKLLHQPISLKASLLSINCYTNQYPSTPVYCQSTVTPTNIPQGQFTVNQLLHQPTSLISLKASLLSINCYTNQHPSCASRPVYCQSTVTPTNVPQGQFTVNQLLHQPTSLKASLLSINCYTNQHPSCASRPVYCQSTVTPTNIPHMPQGQFTVNQLLHEPTSLICLKASLLSINCYTNQHPSCASRPVYCQSTVTLTNFPHIPQGQFTVNQLLHQPTSLMCLKASLLSINCYTNQHPSRPVYCQSTVTPTNIPHVPQGQFTVNQLLHQPTSLMCLKASLLSINCYTNQLPSYPSRPVYCQSTVTPTNIPHVPQGQFTVNQLLHQPTSLKASLLSINCYTNQHPSRPVYCQSTVTPTNIPQGQFTVNQLLHQPTSLKASLLSINCYTNQHPSRPVYCQSTVTPTNIPQGQFTVNQLLHQPTSLKASLLSINCYTNQHPSCASRPVYCQSTVTPTNIPHVPQGQFTVNQLLH